MPPYPYYSDNMYSGLDDSDAPDEPRVDRGGNENRNTHGYGLGSALGGGFVGGTGAADGAAVAAGAVASTVVGPDVVGLDARVAGHDDDHDQVLSPTDGYFGRSADSCSPDRYIADRQSTQSPSHQTLVVDAATPSSHYPAETSSQVPHVPNVWVHDPSLEQGTTAESKAREAQEERDLNRRRAGRPHPSNFTSLPHAGDGGSSTFPSLNSQTPSSTTTTTIGPGQQSRYAFGPGLSSAPPSQRYTPYTTSSSSFAHPSFSSAAAAPSRSHRSGTIYSERSSLFSEAPPAYTPSPTSPSTSYSNNYQTLRPSHSNMGRISESESRGLLAGGEYQSIPQDMGGQVDDDYTTYTRPMSWRDRVRRRVSGLDRRTCQLVVVGVVLALITVGFLVSSFAGVRDEVSTPCFPSCLLLPRQSSQDKMSPGDRTLPVSKAGVASHPSWPPSSEPHSRDISCHPYISCSISLRHWCEDGRHPQKS
jgi:hypothetical protein